MSEWRSVRLSVLLHAIDNDHRFLLLRQTPGGKDLTFRAIKDFPYWRNREHLMIPIGGLRKCLILAFCYENRLEIVNDCSMPLHRALGYRTKQSMSRSGYGEIYTFGDAPSRYKGLTDFQGTDLERGLNECTPSIAHRGDLDYWFYGVVGLRSERNA